jgi:hypothetical protein
MPVTRLLAIAALLCAGQTFAQTANNSETAVVQDAGSVASSNDFASDFAATQFRISPYPQVDSVEPAVQPDDPIKAQSESRKELLKLLDLQRNGPRFISGPPLPGDSDCFYIYSYLMVRDNPHSDSTHYAGYTTCVPAARVRMYTTVEHER